MNKLTAGSQRLIPLSEKQVRQLKDKSLLAPGLNAVIDRNIALKTKAVVKNGNLYIKENGRYLKIITADASDPDKFADTASALFKGKKGRFNVWVRFKNGRSNSSFTDEKALLNFIAYIYEKYEPDWQAEGHEIDDFIDGFEVYEQPKGIKARKKKQPPRQNIKRKPHRKKRAKSFVQRAVKARFKPTKPRAKRVLKKAKTNRGKKAKNRRR